MIKIAVPWPTRKESHPRVDQALRLWPDRRQLLLCLIDPTANRFVAKCDSAVMDRNSTDIGTKFPKCYIHDMVRAAVDGFPGQDFYGFANSDVVPIEHLTKGLEEYEALIFHRTELTRWEELSKRPKGDIFFWGQDMFLFRVDVVERVLNHLKKQDPIIGTGGFDPRLTRWLLENTKAKRIVNRLYHKRHSSEWKPLEIEYAHNGGDIPVLEHFDYYGFDAIEAVYEGGYDRPLPIYLQHFCKRAKPEAYAKLANAYPKHFALVQSKDRHPEAYDMHAKLVTR